MAIGAGWHTEEGWKFHVESKNVIRKWIENPSDIGILRLMFVDEKWANVTKGDYVPINYMLLAELWKDFREAYPKFEPSLVERLVIPKLAIFVLTCYKEDTAYLERIGGVITCMLDDMNVEEFKDPEKRLDAIVALEDWWYRNDQRPRAHAFIKPMWDEVIRRYKEEEFTKKSLDFIIDWLIDHKSEWQLMDRFDPNNWYPYGIGQVNFAVTGRGMN